MGSCTEEVVGPDFNTDQNLHPDTVAERYDAEQEWDECQCCNPLKSDKEKRDGVCRECL